MRFCPVATLSLLGQIPLACSWRTHVGDSRNHSLVVLPGMPGCCHADGRWQWPLLTADLTSIPKSSGRGITNWKIIHILMGTISKLQKTRPSCRLPLDQSQKKGEEWQEASHSQDPSKVVLVLLFQKSIPFIQYPCVIQAVPDSHHDQGQVFRSTGLKQALPRPLPGMAAIIRLKLKELQASSTLNVLTTHPCPFTFSSRDLYSGFPSADSLGTWSGGRLPISL